MLKAFLDGESENMGDGHWSLKINDDEISSGFYKYHDAQPYGVLAANCFDYTWSKILTPTQK
jgi:hypothetical protein